MHLRRHHPWKLLLCCICICGFAALALPAHASTQDNVITITAQSDTIDFPTALDFQMTAADSAGSITKATLFLDDQSDSAPEQHDVTPASAGAKASFSWHEATTNDHFMPVGTQINYYWIVVDNVGNSTTGDTQKFQVTDTRFNWQHLTQGMFQVNWYNRPTDFGQTLKSHADTSLQHITGILGIGLTSPINIWVYQTTADFQASLPPDVHEWVGGISFPTLKQTSIVVEDTAAQTLQRDLPHELTHLVFHEGLNIPVPVWFDEGLAVYNQLYHEPSMAQSFRNALARHSLLPLSSITDDFPTDSDQAELAYAESWNLVDYMYTTYGPKSMMAFIKSMHTESVDFNQDMVQALHIDTPHMENQWHLHNNQPATLTGSQATLLHPTMMPQKIPTVSTTDPYAPVWILLGILLIILPMTGFTSLVAYQRRSYRKAQIVQQAQQIIHTALPDYTRNMPYTPHIPYVPPDDYTSPVTYMPPGYQPPGRPGEASRPDWTPQE